MLASRLTSDFQPARRFAGFRRIRPSATADGFDGNRKMGWDVFPGQGEWRPAPRLALGYVILAILATPFSFLRGC
jgi:hypothetical protein